MQMTDVQIVNFFKILNVVGQFQLKNEFSFIIKSYLACCISNNEMWFIAIKVTLINLT